MRRRAARNKAKLCIGKTKNNALITKENMEAVVDTRSGGVIYRPSGCILGRCGHVQLCKEIFCLRRLYFWKAPSPLFFNQLPNPRARRLVISFIAMFVDHFSPVQSPPLLAPNISQLSGMISVAIRSFHKLFIFINRNQKF